MKNSILKNNRFIPFLTDFGKSWNAAQAGFLIFTFCHLSIAVAAGSANPVASTEVAIWSSKPENSGQILRRVIPSFSIAGAENASEKHRFTGNLNKEVIYLRPDQVHQKIEGFGAALTEASVINILKLNAPERKEMLEALFSDQLGSGLNLIRVPMGSSDLADGKKGEYTYDDSPGNKPDPELRHFSIKRDEKTLRVLSEIKKINPDMKIMINPWSAPAWMKDNKSLYRGNFESKHMNSFRRYFIRTIEEYQRHGLDVDYVGIQNEPGIDIDYPSMLMTDDQQSEFIKMLGAELQSRGFKAKILANDDNYAAMDRVIKMTSDPETSRFIHAAAFHCWSNDQERLLELSSKVMTIETECGGNIESTNFSYDFNWWHKNRIVDGLSRGLSGIITWNMVSDDKAGPFGAGPQGCKTCRGLVVLRKNNKKVLQAQYQSEFYALSHAAKFIKRGAVRIGTELRGTEQITKKASDIEADKISHVAFRNPDGSFVVILNNWSQESRRFSLYTTDQNKSSSIPAATYELGSDEALTVVIH